MKSNEQARQELMVHKQHEQYQRVSVDSKDCVCGIVEFIHPKLGLPVGARIEAVWYPTVRHFHVETSSGWFLVEPTDVIMCCSECGCPSPDDDRVYCGMKCGRCAYGR